MTSASPTTRTIDLPGNLPITINEYGENTEGQAVLVLHGGAGPRSMAGISAALSEHVYTITPTHPGFDATPRPEQLDSIAGLAEAYLGLLDELDLTGVMVLGNSIGGWIAAEMATRDDHKRLGAIVLINAVGVQPDQEGQIVDVRTINPGDIGKLSFANQALRPDFSTFTDQQRAAAAANQKTLAVYGGPDFSYDPTLRGRLPQVAVPALVVWGEQDGVATIEYGRSYAASFPNGHFTPIAEAGHLPQIEQPAATLAAIGTFVNTVVKPTEAA
jgi:pimeloyl-ACP methyl ester carboxylesterase